MDASFGAVDPRPAWPRGRVDHSHLDAHSPVSNKNEPMDWVRSYGKGRVYTTMLGHTWVGESTV